MLMPLILNLTVAIGVCMLLGWQQARALSFTKRVFSALGLGVLLGAAFQLMYGSSSPVVTQTNAYLDIIGTGYVQLLQMIVMPLIMVSIVGAILKLSNAAELGKISALTIGILIGTTIVAASIGILMAHAYGLNASGLVAGTAELARGEVLQGKLATAKALSIPDMILSFIPTNPFLDMTGARKTSTIAVVVFSIFVGMAGIGIADKKPAAFASFKHGVDVAHAVIMHMVSMVLRLTPYGVFALMTQVVAGTSPENILKLLSFVAASYSALLLMFCVHLALITVIGLHPVRYVKKVWPLLAFAFTSRTSAGAIPMSVQTQTARLGTAEGIANFAASFIGPLLAIVAIGSVGVAGVGGGATFAALIVLSSLDLPVALAGLLISVEPIIDMGRTALNVSGSVTAGAVTSRLLGQTDMAVFQSDADVNLDSDQIAA